MWKNRVKTGILLAALSGVFLWIGSFWGQSGLTFAIFFALIMNVGSYWFSDKIVLKMYNAQEVSQSDFPKIHKMVDELSKKAGIPKPRIFIVPSEQPNAFATGRNPENSVVAFTKGILDVMDEEELRGVAAHELSHIKNRDTLITTIASTIAAVISYVAMIARWGALFGFGGRGGDEGGGILELLVLAIVTPLIATVLQLAISRSREFMADESGARLVGSGEGLAKGLQKLESHARQKPMRMGRESTSSLFIVNPFSKKGLVKLFSTHPPTEERVEKLKSLDLN